MTAPGTVIATTIPNGVERCPAWVIHALEWLQTAAALTGMAVIAIGFLGAVYLSLSACYRQIIGTPRRSMIDEIKHVRLFLGYAILLGLELIIVSDLVHSILKPDLSSLYALGLTVIIRTVISYFLGKELEGVRYGAQPPQPDLEGPEPESSLQKVD